MLPFVHMSNNFPEETKLYISPDQDGHRPKRAYTQGQTCEKQDEEQMQAVVNVNVNVNNLLAISI